MASKAEQAQQSMEDAARRRRVERVRAAAKRLDLVESQLQHAMAALPAMLREVQAIRTTITKALAGQDEEEDTDGD